MSEMNVPTDAPVLVTGATGYVAGRLIERLLQAGLTVHATARDASKTEQLQYLQDLADASPGSIRFFSADLLGEGSFGAAMQGCRVVFHTASPFVMEVKDAQKELIEPAVKGTENVLASVEATPTVQRVVLTSSCAAIYGDNIDLQQTPHGVFDEEVWNTTSTLGHNPYSLSKTLAEKRAWELAAAQDRWHLVVCNPAMVMGPGVKIHGSSESFNLMKQIIDGTMAMAMPDLRIGVVDVRDLAEAHFRAAFLPDASGRHVLVGSDSGVPGIVEALEPRWKGKLKLPARIAPKWLLWLIGPFMGLTRTAVSRNIGLPWKSDTTKSREKLGLVYRPLAETVDDFAQQLIDEGIVTPV